MGSLGRCAFHDTGGEPLDVIDIAKIHIGVEAVALFHVNEIQHTDIVTFFLQEGAGHADDLALGIQHHKAGIGIQQILVYIASSLAGA